MCSASLLLSTPVETVKGRNPNTKLQQKCLDLAGSLPALTEAQRQWARRSMNAAGYLVVRGRGGKDRFYWCQECGQVDKTDNTGLIQSVTQMKHTCSCCGRKLEVSAWRPRYDHKYWADHDFTFGVVTVCEGMQVVRVFNWHQANVLGSPTINHIDEVFQIWFDPIKGKQVIISKPYTWSFWNFRWAPHNPWKVVRRKQMSYYYNDVHDISNLEIYPRAKVLPIIRRNGWRNAMLKMKSSPVEIWKGLLADPSLEGLAKTGQYDVMDYWFQHGGMRRDKSQWLSIVRICNRRKYVIKDASMWFDYIDLLEYFHKDIHNAHYVCPDDLRKEHDRLMEKKTRIEKAKELQKRIAEASKHEASYKKHRGMFFGICFGDKNIVVTVIASVKEMAEEGTMMHHCVYANRYYDHKVHPDSLILSAKDKDGNRLETVEVNTKTWQIMQSRGLLNKNTPEHDKIVDLVRKNMYLIQQANKHNAA